MSVELSRQYKVVPGRNVDLTLNIGEGQRGRSLVMLDFTVLPFSMDDDGNIASLQVGEGQSLVGKRLRVFSTVSDVNPSTNRTSITYRLNGGAVPLVCTLDFTVSQPGDKAEFVASFNFVA